jgi:RHS repeat-associated protein
VSHQSGIVAGVHQQYFWGASPRFPVRDGGKLYAHVFLDPLNPPQEVMLQWGEDTQGWEHRAYWGANLMGWGTDGTNSRRYMGPLPAAGGWVRLEVPASAVGLEGKEVHAMAFTLYGGRASWDLAGAEGWTTVPDHMECSWNGWDYDCYWVYRDEYENRVIMDDSIPAGASPGADGGDGWNWRGANNVDLVHQHYFYNASNTLQVSAGDKLFAWVYLDSAKPPAEVMLQWCSNESGWSHRAYWGANNIPWGTDGTFDRKYVGPLPQAGVWVKLEIPASAVGLEGKIVNGMAFTLYGGRAAWDKAGKVSPGPLAGAGPPINSKAYVVDATTNRLQPPSGSGTMQYDAAGNLEIDPYTSGASQRFVYDGENRLVEVKNGAGVTVSRCVYDADGQRVRRIIGGQETWHVYGIGGELLAEYSAGAAPSAPQKEYGYRNGQLLVVWDVSEIGDRQLQWLVQDHLGSTRMVVDRSGSLGGIRRHDFATFGEELSAGVGIRNSNIGYSLDAVSQKFVSKKRDTETGFDFFGARYYASIQGRFTSVDPSQVSIDIGNPQSWNRYSYTLNNPLAYIDHNGKWSTEIHERIIDMAFKGWSEKNIKIIKQASKDMDNPLYGGQNEDRSYQHAMKARKESSWEAEKRMKVFVLEKVNEARSKYKEGKIDEGVYAFGEGLHTLMDWTSPAHEGFQDWWLPGTPEGFGRGGVGLVVSKSILFYFMYKQHSAMEAAISAERMGMATGMAFAYTSHVWSEEEAIIERGGTSPGAYDDPYIQELRRIFRDEPSREAEAEYLYRVGVARGKERFKRIIK